MKRHGHLFERIAEYRSLLAASNRARRGKRDRIDVAHFVFHLEHNLLALQIRPPVWDVSDETLPELSDPRAQAAAHMRRPLP